MTFGGGDSLRWVILAFTICEHSIVRRDKLYTFSLASPTPSFPHGALSEDGFYKVSDSETVVWFQLCDAMIFNHNPPTCIDCKDCGGPSHCSTGCSVLVSNKIGGYPMCITVGHTSSMTIHLMDEENPHMGVVVTMSNCSPMHNCSLTVSVIYDSSGLQASQLRHPSGCAMSASIDGKGLGWFGTFIIIIFCLFGGYLLARSIYWVFYQGVCGVASMFMSLVWKFRGPSEGYRSCYSPVKV